MIFDKIEHIQSQTIFFHLKDFHRLNYCYLKIESLNIAGSIKLKAATYVLDELEKHGHAVPSDNTIICSSSGNFGVAMAILCHARGYEFICITDPNISTLNERQIQIYGGTVTKMTKTDRNGGYLGSRLQYINTLLKENSSYIFADQYANEDNIEAHVRTTAKEIDDEFSKLDYLFVGTGTTATLMGCLRYYKQKTKRPQIIAVDAEGSLTFGGKPAKRLISGLGTSHKPSIADSEKYDELFVIPERDSIKMCHRILKKYGLFIGGSTGTVLCAVAKAAEQIARDQVIVAISPDSGNNYVDTIYCTEWVNRHFGNLD